MSEKTESKNKALVLKVFDTLFITFAAKAILLRPRRSKMAPAQSSMGVWKRPRVDPVVWRRGRSVLWRVDFACWSLVH